MMMDNLEFKGINSALIGLARLLINKGVERRTRNYICHEIPYPVIIKITNPLARIVTIPNRKWNYTLPFIESLWIASGRNDLDMVKYYVKKLGDFSDNDSSLRGAYGPRLRNYIGISDDYEIGHKRQINSNNTTIASIDQFAFIEQTFAKDPYTRQAIISIPDPAKDFFANTNELKKTKDFPCTKSFQFIRNDNKLDMIVHMRSNDFVWGTTGVNIFNFTFIQEYFSKILRLPIGNYYHIVNNFHYYDYHTELLKQLADSEPPVDEGHNYNVAFASLSEFDEKRRLLEEFEASLRIDKEYELIDFGDDFFNDWSKVLYRFHQPTTPLTFANPVLQSVINSSANNVRG